MNVQLLDIAEERVDVLDAEAGDNALKGDAPVEGAAEILEQSHFAVCSGGEVAVAALGRDGSVAHAVPDEHSFAEAGSSGDEALVADRIGIAGVQGEYLVGGELGDAIAVGFQIIDEEDVANAEGALQVASVEDPWKICEFETPVTNRAGAAEAGGCDEALIFSFGSGAEEAVNDLFKAAELMRGKLEITDGKKVAFDHAVEREVNLGAAYVACEDHLAQLQSAGIR